MFGVRPDAPAFSMVLGYNDTVGGGALNLNLIDSGQGIVVISYGHG